MSTRTWVGSAARDTLDVMKTSIVFFIRALFGRFEQRAWA
jgi:hypothetical protein